MRIEENNNKKYISHAQIINHFLLKNSRYCALFRRAFQELCALMLHIGSKIKEVHKASGLSVTVFAKKIHCSRRSVYLIFGKPSIDTGMLQRIGSLLRHDFFQYYTTGDPLLKAGETCEEQPSGIEKLARLEREMAALKQAVDLLAEKAGKASDVTSDHEPGGV